MIHIDIYGYLSPYFGGQRYFITFINIFSCYGYIFLLHKKFEALEVFKMYKAEVENQLEKKIKILRSDREEEYTSNKFFQFCQEHNIIHQVTALYSPQSNSIAEHKNLLGYGKYYVYQFWLT